VINYGKQLIHEAIYDRHDESIPILLEWDAVGIQQASKRAEIALNGDLYPVWSECLPLHGYL
jgi:hypothetical protein